MDLKTLAKIEYKNWKRRMIDETSGTYVLIYMGFIFEVFISALYGFRYNKDNISTLSGLVAFTVILYQTFGIAVAATLICALIGGWFGQKMIKKHFVKAGIVS